MRLNEDNYGKHGAKSKKARQEPALKRTFGVAQLP
ncbi:hypothetical protein EM595_3170 [Duffyella gerundensis]|uniref:Uncharacterized protein n=1 Tax=Duffyella gerundensis TaxID=1619313 RepID=A0A0U5L3N0_9GAMM|nr:hypothetical protein EM595_3170 [Duffyella gerundensis]